MFSWKKSNMWQIEDLQLADRVNIKIHTIEDFLNIKDKDLQRFILVKGGVHSSTNFKVVDNEEKLGFYMIGTDVKVNQVGSFYRKNTLYSWIVYNKKTKKVKLKLNGGGNLIHEFLGYYFKYPIVVSDFTLRLSPTLAKKIIE